MQNNNICRDPFIQRLTHYQSLIIKKLRPFWTTEYARKEIYNIISLILTDYRGSCRIAVGSCWLRHLWHLKMYLMMRTRARILAITSSCMRLKHMAINAIPEKRRRKKDDLIREARRKIKLECDISSIWDIIARIVARFGRSCVKAVGANIR